MKTLSCFVVLICLFHHANSQIYINKKNINADSTIRYFELTHDTYPTTFYITSIDIGDRRAANDDICDANGKRIKFRTPVEVLNYVTNNGWKLVDRNVIVKNYSRSSDNSEAKTATVFLLFERK